MLKRYRCKSLAKTIIYFIWLSLLKLYVHCTKHNLHPDVFMYNVPPTQHSLIEILKLTRVVTRAMQQIDNMRKKI